MKQISEPQRAAYLYDKDVQLLKEFMNRKGILAIRDAVRICVEFTNAHGGLS